MSDRKHLYWVVGLISITLILCGTLIWINYNSWTLRFEMDENTKEAIKSIDFAEISDIDKTQDETIKNNTYFAYYELEGNITKDFIIDWENNCYISEYYLRFVNSNEDKIVKRCSSKEEKE